MKSFLSAVLSTTLLLALPMLIKDSSGRPYLQIEPDIAMMASTYTSPYQRMLKRVVTSGEAEKQEVVLWAWQDFSGDMNFSDSVEKPHPKALRMTVEDTKTGLFSVGTEWVYVTMLVLWFGAFFLLKALLGLIFDAGANKREVRQWNQTKQPPPKRFTSSAAKSAYDLLEVKKSDSWEDIKRAYKRKMSQYHPDKVEQMAPEFKKVAKEKATELNKAFEQIRKEKGK